MFISIKKIMLHALNICMSSVVFWILKWEKKTELINMSTSGVGENRNTALLGRHVLGENFYRHVADGGKAIVWILGEPVLWTRMIGK